MGALALPKSKAVHVTPIHFERTVKPSFPRRACPVLDTGRESTPWPHIYGGITVTWYHTKSEQLHGQLS